jgi:multidrug resistance efflux pump
MVELIVGTYGVLCWLVLVKFKLVPINVYTIFTAMAGGVVILVVLFICLSVFHPVSHDGRMYAPVVQIVPEVRGVVIDVPVEPNKPLNKGDVLFRIEPRPFQIEVDRLRAALAGKNSKFAQLAEQVAAAEAATRQARANLLASESTFDRQLREAHERAKSQVVQVKERLELAGTQFGRAKELMAKGAGSQADYDRTEAHFQSLQQEYSQAETDERIAAEKLKSGSASLEAARQALAQAEAAERKVRTEFNAQVDGQNPEVRETMAMLDKARYDLDQTTVRAPTEGYVPQVVLRPGTMATATRLVPLMMFVAGERPTLSASFSQKVISDIRPGMQAEVIFKQQPGRSYKVKVRRVLTAVREGELDASGQLLEPTSAHEHGYIPIVFDYDEDIANLNLPVGAQASIAIYTDRVHALSIVRKILLRMKSWENFIF